MKSRFIRGPDPDCEKPKLVKATITDLNHSYNMMLEEKGK